MVKEYPDLVTTLPPELNTDELLPIITKGVEQWSRMTAWSWSSCLAFADDPEKAEQEKDLKTYLIKTLQQQAQYADAFVSYGDGGNPSTEDLANILAGAIKILLLGVKDQDGYTNKDKLPDFPPRVTITLDDVCLKLTGERLITTTKPEIEELFLVRVITNSFSGSISYAKDKDGVRIPDRYIFFIAYPPRPALSEITVTEQQLHDWARKLTPGESYLPPSPYIPIAGT